MRVATTFAPIIDNTFFTQARSAIQVGLALAWGAMRQTEFAFFSLRSAANPLSSASNAMSTPSYCDPRKPAHSMGTTSKSTLDCISSQTAAMLSPTISGPQALNTNAMGTFSDLASRIVRAKVSSPPYTISSSQSLVHRISVSV